MRALPRRVLVDEERADAARRLLELAGMGGDRAREGPPDRAEPADDDRPEGVDVGATVDPGVADLFRRGVVEVAVEPEVPERLKRLENVALLPHLGTAALEVREAIDTLHGSGPADFVAHCLEVAGWMLKLAGQADSPAAARDLAATARFYEEVLGLPLALDQGDCRIFRHGSFLFGFCERDVPPQTASVLLTLVLDDVDGMHARLVAAGSVGPDAGALVTLHGCGETIRTCKSDIRVFCDRAIVRTGARLEPLQNLKIALLGDNNETVTDQLYGKVLKRQRRLGIEFVDPPLPGKIELLQRLAGIAIAGTTGSPVSMLSLTIPG